jgi:hypothetical protein
LALVNFGEAYEIEEDFTLGDLVITMLIECFENMIVPRLPIPNAALFPGWISPEAYDVASWTRQCAELTARGRSDDRAALARASFASNLPRFFRQGSNV